MAKYIADNYRIIKEITSTGNMSRVYKCRADDDDNEYAVKVFNKVVKDANSEELQERLFNREVEILKKTNHMNIVSIHDYGLDDDLGFYIALEYIDGKNLSEMMIEYSRSEAAAFELAEQICLGIEHLHKKNIIHRDIKPSNIMITSDGVVKVIDFGISKLQDTFYSEYTVMHFSTPKYSAPEQSLGKDVTYKSDVYSLGAVFYELFSGEKIVKIDDINLQGLNVNIRKIIKKMLSQNPNDRYDNVIEVRVELSKIKANFKEIRTLSLGITNKVASVLFHNNFINKEEIPLAQAFLNKDLAFQNYFTSWISHKENMDSQKNYMIYSKQFGLACSLDRRDSNKFTIVGLRVMDNAELINRKENSYLIPYELEISNVKKKNMLSALDLIEEFEEFKQASDIDLSNDRNAKELSEKWKTILELQRKQITQEKAIQKYTHFKYNEKEHFIEVYFNSNQDNYNVEFSTEDMLQMSSKYNKYSKINVGFMRDYTNKSIIIDLVSDVDIDNIQIQGEVSIDLNMRESALKRQEDAWKKLRFREMLNPELCDVILKPEIAKSTIKYPFNIDDCNSKLMDESKIRSLDKAMGAHDFYLLQGPPGTGKTTFITELVYQINKSNPNAKILIASQSNVAVDHSLTKINDAITGLKLVRIGNKEKFSKFIADEHTLDEFCKKWKNDVVVNCKLAIEELKNTLSIDEELQDKNNILFEIEKIESILPELIKEQADVNSDINELSSMSLKWSSINESITLMKSKISNNINLSKRNELSNILNVFSDTLVDLNDELSSVIEESFELSDKYDELEYRLLEIDEMIEENKKNLDDWKDLLGVQNDKEYLSTKKELKQLISEQEKEYAKFHKIEKLCKEWQEKVTLNDTLLEESLMDSTVIGATCLGIAKLASSINFNFDWVIIDEAGKATPTEILVPICLGKKVILVGDHKQLPPVVDDSLVNADLKISRTDLETSLFEYMEMHLPEECKGILNEQYRMNPVIGSLISKLFYQEQLISKTDKSKKTIPLKMYKHSPLVWISTANRNGHNEEKLGITYRNTCEVTVIFEQLLQINEELKELKLFKEVAIIAGYKAQKEYINYIYNSQYKSVFSNLSIEVNTVDAFQGRETDIVFYSVVRSNEGGNIGFLKDMRRLNVAFSRARELLIIVGDHKSVTRKTDIFGEQNPFVEALAYIYANPTDCFFKEV